MPRSMRPIHGVGSPASTAPVVEAVYAPPTNVITAIASEKKPNRRPSAVPLIPISATMKSTASALSTKWPVSFAPPAPRASSSRDVIGNNSQSGNNRPCAIKMPPIARSARLCRAVHHVPTPNPKTSTLKTGSIALRNSRDGASVLDSSLIA